MAYVFGAGTVGFGAQSGWELQGSEITKEKNVIQAFGSMGDEVAITAINEIERVTSNYICSNATNTVPANIGAEVNGYVLEGISLGLSQDGYATMRLTGHKHSVGSPAAPSQTVAHGITVAQAFGIPTAPQTSASTGNSGADWISYNIDITVEHVEAVDKDGSSVAHENKNAQIVVSATALSAITLGMAGYTQTTNSGPSNSNAAYETYTASAQLKKTLA